jgi:hypothetical protein
MEIRGGEAEPSVKLVPNQSIFQGGLAVESVTMGSDF